MSLQSYIDPQELRAALRPLKANGQRVGFVPTMGALHEGHLSLVEQLKGHCEIIVASIFVNPKQFGPNEDFASYPRMLKEDLQKLADRGVHMAFIPNAKDMYPDGFQTEVINNDMSKVLCGRYRPGHFDGVLTIVIKLLNMVGPDLAIFGKKDYQQLQIIQAMVRDLNMPVEILGGEIVREEDGLAMSSRNLRLSKELRAEAAKLYSALQAVKDRFDAGERNAAQLESLVCSQIDGSSFDLQYAEIRDQKHLNEFRHEVDKPAVLAIAAYLGGVRLIDNIELG